MFTKRVQGDRLIGEWSECLTTNEKVSGSIPGTFTILKAD